MPSPENIIVEKKKQPTNAKKAKTQINEINVPIRKSFLILPLVYHKDRKKTLKNRRRKPTAHFRVASKSYPGIPNQYKVILP